MRKLKIATVANMRSKCQWVLMQKKSSRTSGDIVEIDNYRDIHSTSRYSGRVLKNGGGILGGIQLVVKSRYAAEVRLHPTDNGGCLISEYMELTIVLIKDITTQTTIISVFTCKRNARLLFYAKKSYINGYNL